MAGKISDLTALTGTAAATTDLIETVDISDTSMAGTGTNKKMTLAELVIFLNANGISGGGGGAPVGTKMTDLTALAGTAAATGDIFEVVDISDTTMAASGTNKKISLVELVTFLTANGVQASDPDLTTLAGLTATTNNFIVSVGSAWASRTPAQVKTTLAIANTDVSGLGTMSTQAATAVAITGGSVTGITDLAVADGGTGASTLTGVVKGNGTGAFTAAAQLAVADGGTGRATGTTAYGLVAVGTTATGVQQTVNPAASGFLKTTSTTALPAWTALADADLPVRAANSLMGNNTGSTATPIDLTVAQVKTMLAIDNITVGTTQPGSPALNDLWVDTNP